MKLNALFDTLSASMVGRDEEIRAIIRATIAQEHCLMIGEPGTGKSFVTNNFARATGLKYFGVLLTRFSTPEELFGPYRMTMLKQDEYVRNSSGRLPEVQFAMVDEIFKASSAIINTLLTIMQERVFDNGGVRVPCPLRTLVGASNEFPEAGELDAVYDRFLVRRYVKYIPKHLRRKLVFGMLPTVQQTTTPEELANAYTEAMAIPFSATAEDSFLEIWETLETDGVTIGDRRAGKARKIAQAEAWLQGDTEVKTYHLECLVDVFWSRLDDLRKVEDTVRRLSNPDEMILSEWIEYLDELKGQRLRSHQMVEATSAAAKLRTIIDETGKMKDSPKVSAIQAGARELLDSMTAILIPGQTSDLNRRLRERVAAIGR